MIKKLLNLSTGTFLLISFVSNAQPTITAAGSNPVVGDHLSLANSSYVAPGNSGAAQTWNFSSMTSTSTQSSDGVTVASTPNASDFSNANVALHLPASSANLYYKTSASAQQYYGSAQGATLMSYSNPEDMMHFPFTYNNTYSDPWAVTFLSGGYTFFRKGTTTVTADGYGTVVSPAGSFANVLRVHFVQNYTDSAYLSGAPFVTVYVNDEYMWYKDGNHYPLVFAYSITANAGTPSQGAGYLSNPLGVNDIENIVSEYSISPNPASELLKLNFTLLENKKVNVKVFNSLGQNMQIEKAENGMQGFNVIQLDLAMLPEGIYFAQIMLDGAPGGTKRFVISK